MMQSTLVRSLLFPWLLALLLVILGPTWVSQAATLNLNVDRSDDPALTTAGTGAAACTTALNDCSLRGAILKANAPSGDVYVINVPTGTFTLTQTGAAEDGDLTGDLDITRDVTIAGAGASATVIHGNTIDRTLDVLTGTVTISGVTIRGGKAPNGPPGTIIVAGGSGENGGGIRNTSALTLSNVMITANYAGAGGAGSFHVIVGTFPGGPGGAGGAVYNSGALTIINSTVDGNGAGDGGIGGLGFPMFAPMPGAPGGTGGNGGGIYNAGTLTVTGTILQSNSAGSGGIGGAGSSGALIPASQGAAGGSGGSGGNGGGIYNSGSMSLVRTAVAGNLTGNGGSGGAGGAGISGMMSSGPGTAGGPGGSGGVGGSGSGIYNRAQTTVTNSTLSGNTDGNGGAGAAGGTGGMGATAPATPGGNGGNGGNGGTGGSGGIYNGVYATATITITSATITANNAGTGGSAGSGGSGGLGGPGMPNGANGSAGVVGGAGIGGGVALPSGTLSPKNTILANNTIPAGGLGPDCFGTLTSQGYNLIRDKTNCTVGGSTTGDITGQDPLLNSLADNGGGTLTHALQYASPARDAGDPAGCKDPAGNLLLVDQRGWARTVGVRCDMGAFEWQGNQFLPLIKR